MQKLLSLLDKYKPKKVRVARWGGEDIAGVCPSRLKMSNVMVTYCRLLYYCWWKVWCCGWVKCVSLLMSVERSLGTSSKRLGTGMNTQSSSLRGCVLTSFTSSPRRRLVYPGWNVNKAFFSPLQAGTWGPFNAHATTPASICTHLPHLLIFSLLVKRVNGKRNYTPDCE